MHYFFILIGQLFQVYNIANGIKPGSNSKILMSMLLIAQKLYVGASSDLCEMNKLFYNNVIKGIRLLDKKQFCFYRKKFVRVRAFEGYFPLSVKALKHEKSKHAIDLRDKCLNQDNTCAHKCKLNQEFLETETVVQLHNLSYYQTLVPVSFS